MSEWKEFSLQEFAELVKNTYKPTGIDDYLYIGLEHIEQESLRLNSIGHSTDVSSTKFFFDVDDILFGKLRPYFRKVVKPKFSGICSTDIWVFRAKECFSQDFLFFFLANWDFIDISTGGEGGTRMPRADWQFLSKSKWLLPPLPEQRAIASVLSSLDDKIDLLHRQNKTLEAMAETLFRQWFVEEADEEWEEGKILDYCLHHKDGVKPQNQPNEIFSHYSIPAFDNSLNPVIECGSEIQSNKYSVVQNSFLFSKLNPNKVKRIWLILDDLNENAICSTEFQVVRPKDKKYLFFTYLWLSIPQNYDEIASGVGGTSGSHQRIDPADIFNFACPLIGDDLLISLNSKVAPIFMKVMENRVQIQTLEKLRDTLLPKLMSGEVRVKV
jgi:type I restriction enzyme S subunit